MNPETILEFQALVGRIEASKTLRVVVFDSANPDYFFGRYDISRAAETPTSRGPTGLGLWTNMTVRISQAPVVSIALIRGRTRGGGPELPLALDMRFASLEKAVFGQPEVGAGIFPGGGGLDRLPLLTGRARSKLPSAARTLTLPLRNATVGWINRALPDAELDAHVERLARRIASFDREALAETKRLINRRTLPDPRDLTKSAQVFPKAVATWPTAQLRIAKMTKKMAEVGPAEFEKNMGRYFGEL